MLGLDRAPEVKTLRRKLSELAGYGRGALLQAALGRHHVTARPDAMGFLYLDGHVRVYTGTRELPKTHIARMRIAGPATEETWVGDADGDPVMVITAAPSQSLAAELARLLPGLRAIIGPDRACTVVFDRGGYSPQVFTEIITAGFDVLTYFKGAWARSVTTAFAAVDFTAPDGTAHSYELAERLIDLPVPAQPATAGQEAKPATTLVLRLIVRASPGGHQTPILTNRADLSPAQVAYRMAARWRQENYFKYAREHFALDAPDSYADIPDDLNRLVPNPAKAYAADQVSDARAQLAAAQGGVVDAIDAAGIRARATWKWGQGHRRPGRRTDPRRRHHRPGRSQGNLGHHRQSPTAGTGPPRQPVAGDRNQTADPRDPDERLQRRKRPGPATTPALRPRRRRSPRPSPGSVHPHRRPTDHRQHPARPARPRQRPPTQQRPNRTLCRAHRHHDPLPRHRPRPRLQHQRPPRDQVKDLTMSGVLDSWVGPNIRDDTPPHPATFSGVRALTPWPGPYSPANFQARLRATARAVSIAANTDGAAPASAVMVRETVASEATSLYRPGSSRSNAMSANSPHPECGQDSGAK